MQFNSEFEKTTNVYKDIVILSNTGVMNETETELVKLNHGVVDLIAKWEVSYVERERTRKEIAIK